MATEHKANQLISGKLHFIGKVWFTQKNFVSSIMGLCFAEIKARHKGVGIALGKSLW